MEDYRTIDGRATAEVEEKHSRFIALAAFADSEEKALAAAKVVTVRACVRLSVEVDYALYERAAQLLQAAGAKLDEPVFTDRVTLSALLPAFAELSRGAAQPQVTPPFYAPF